MDDQQALRIVSALANGTDPNSGEIFAADSPYQSPDVIRALFVATRALERSASRSVASAGAKPASQERNGISGNAGKPWSADEDRQLLAEFDSGKSLNEIAQTHGRTHGGVRARLEKHGRLEPSPATRWPAKTNARNDSARDTMR